MYCAIDWLRSYQKQISFSFIEKFILAAGTFTDRGAHVAEKMQPVCTALKPMLLILKVYSFGHYSTNNASFGKLDYHLNEKFSIIQKIPR